jgi:hypothetical protein
MPYDGVMEFASATQRAMALPIFATLTFAAAVMAVMVSYFIDRSDPTGRWLGSLVMLDEGTAVIFIGLLLSLLVAGKYDNTAFRIAFTAAMILSLSAILMMHGDISLTSIAAVFVLSLIDEMVDAYPADDDLSFKAQIMRQRPFLKIGVLILCLTGALPSFMYLFAFLSFDFGYSMIDVASTSGCGNGRV